VTISKGVAALTVVLAIASYWFLPHADFPDYGKFADDAVSTSRNVVSNAGLLLVGAIGTWWSMRYRGDDRAAALTLFGGLIATAFGSAYFHATPLLNGQLNRWTLLWDRMPMTVAFAGMLALVLRDRVFHRPNRIALPVLAGIGVATALYWYASGDLWPYAFFQFYLAAGTLLMIMTLRPSHTEAGYAVASVFAFGLSKVFEDFDREIHAHWGIGGHPLKHVAGAIAALMILLWLRKRSAHA
jgi:hypothetical protein